jgi:hypothetical protein
VPRKFALQACETKREQEEPDAALQRASGRKTERDEQAVTRGKPFGGRSARTRDRTGIVPAKQRSTSRGRFRVQNEQRPKLRKGDGAHPCNLPSGTAALRVPRVFATTRLYTSM